ncbi:glycosyltransferase [filamentous cyanobacterium LEGE 11480]|uniref:Glycosyltransferase n=1 Tax=Romeriopsis navalis LEGE 11480 TaxID=2777977 RepID=A0A928VP24_9CYAN|nr:glycosyltransferase family 2 protein [Romeriopsis navalis]MBE9031152.1 glycosyltransferase [Romeriopsis navalis LEGE 11480]
MTHSVLPDAIALGLLTVQIPAVAILLSRLLRGPWRQPPLQPQSATPEMAGQVSAVVPTLNEVERLTPCLQGLAQQTAELREVTIVDSRSTDGTQALVKAAQQDHPRLQLMEDDPLPEGWVGRPWALHSGWLASDPQARWILGIDADTQPQPGLIPSLLQTAAAQDFDLITLSPQFILQYPGEIWLQPALLMTLVYRFGAAGDLTNAPERVMANGQCFFCKQSVLKAINGYTIAASSFCDDVTLARAIAKTGAKVGFLDGAKVIKVRMYEGLQETWREWGRSLDLKDASERAPIMTDLWVLTMTQGFPIGLLIWSHILLRQGDGQLPVVILGSLNLLLAIIRFALNFAILPSYDLSAATGKWLFWLSPLADPLAVARIWLSANRTPTEWRGRTYTSASKINLPDPT